MTNKNLTEIICIIDKSGSMSTIEKDAIGGFNTFLADQKKVPGDARLTLVFFDHTVETLHNGVNLQHVPDLTAANYRPNGMTALLDAIGQTIDKVGRRLHETPENERPGKVLVAILTDGEENSSLRYTLAAIKEMIRHQRDVYGWQFIYLGANQDAFLEAGKLGISPSMTFGYAATGAGVQTAYATASATLRACRVGNDVDLPSGNGPEGAD